MHVGTTWPANYWPLISLATNFYIDFLLLFFYHHIDKWLRPDSIDLASLPVEPLEAFQGPLVWQDYLLLHPLTPSPCHVWHIAEGMEGGGGGLGGGGGEEGGGGLRSRAGLHTWRRAAGWIGAIDQPQSVCSARLLGLCGRRLFLNYYRRQMLVRRCSLSRLDDCSAAASHRHSSAHTLVSWVRRLRVPPFLLQLFFHFCCSSTVQFSDHVVFSGCHPASIVSLNVLLITADARGGHEQKTGNNRKCNLANWFHKHAIWTTRLNLWPVLLYHNKSSRQQPRWSFSGKSFRSVLVLSRTIWISCFIMLRCRLLPLYKK